MGIHLFRHFWCFKHNLCRLWWDESRRFSLLKVGRGVMSGFLSQNLSQLQSLSDYWLCLMINVVIQYQCSGYISFVNVCKGYNKFVLKEFCLEVVVSRLNDARNPSFFYLNKWHGKFHDITTSTVWREHHWKFLQSCVFQCCTFRFCEFMWWLIFSIQLNVQSSQGLSETVVILHELTFLINLCDIFINVKHA